LGDIREDVRGHLNERVEGYFSDLELNRAINYAQRDIAAKTFCIEDFKQLLAVPTQRYIEIPKTDCSVHKIWRVEYVPEGTETVPIRKIVPWWVGSQNVPKSIAPLPHAWFPFGENRINFDPIPASAFHVNVYLSIAPTVELIDDSDVPQVPEELHTLLHLPALFLMRLKRRQYRQALGAYSEYKLSYAKARDELYTKYGQGLDDFKLPQAVLPPQQRQA
jgi:hypothetical protein